MAIDSGGLTLGVLDPRKATAADVEAADGGAYTCQDFLELGGFPNDPYDSDIALWAACQDCGAGPGENCAPTCHQVTDTAPEAS